MPKCLLPVVNVNKMNNEEVANLTRSVNREKNLKDYMKKMQTARVESIDRSRKKRRKELIEDDLRKIKEFQEFIECASNNVDMSSLRDEIAFLRPESDTSSNYIDRDNFSETSSNSLQRPHRRINAPERFSHLPTTLKPRFKKPQPKVLDSNATYEVESINNMNLINNQVYFRVKWLGYSSKENTWEPLENVKDCDALRTFLEQESAGEEENIKRECELVLEEQAAELEVFRSKPKKVIMKELKQFDPVDFQVNQLIYMIIKKDKNYYLNFRKQFKQMVILNHFHQLDIAQYKAHKKITKEIIKKEKNEFSVSIVNDVDFSILNSFEYVRENAFPEVLVQDKVPEQDKLPEQDYGCKCEGGCTRDSKSCCSKQTKSNFAYKIVNGKKRLRRPDGLEMIFECNQNCSCDMNCLNRVTQQPRLIPLQIFKTNDGRGWGVRTMATVPKGTFIIEYTGEIIDQEESIRRGKKYDEIGLSYLFDLDYNDQTEAVYTIDAFKSGNLSRLINHSCEPNCKIWPVTTCGHHSSVIYKVCYFSTRLIRAGEELTFDYGGGTIEATEPTPNEEDKVTGGHNFVRRNRTTDSCKCGAETCRGFIFN